MFDAACSAAERAFSETEEFFATNHDVRFDSNPGTNLLEEPSLRIALIKVLFDLPAPENLKLLWNGTRFKEPDPIL